MLDQYLVDRAVVLAHVHVFSPLLVLVPSWWMLTPMAPHRHQIMLRSPPSAGTIVVANASGCFDNETGGSSGGEVSTDIAVSTCGWWEGAGCEGPNGRSATPSRSGRRLRWWCTGSTAAAPRL